jgi:hypothetical protein
MCFLQFVLFPYCCVLEGDAKEKQRKGEERKQETERHTQGTEPAHNFHTVVIKSLLLSICFPFLLDPCLVLI